MATEQKSAARETAGRPRLRHALAGLVSVVLNVGLAVALAHWSGPVEAEPEPRESIVPLQVMEVERRTVSPVRPASEAAGKTAQSPAATPRLPAPAAVPMPALELARPRPAGDGMQFAEAVLDYAELPRYSTGVPDAAGEPAAEPGQAGGTLDRGPMLIRPPDLSAYYPYRARAEGTTGRTRCRVVVTETGAVAEVRVVRSTPAGVFDYAARRVCRQLAFEPAMQRGRPVRAAVFLNLVWRLEQ